MRLRLILLVLAISSLILVSFLVPLALLLRTFAADRAVSSATAQAQWLEPLVATLSPADLRLTLNRVNAQDPDEPTTVFLPGGQVLGAPAERSPAVGVALRGSSFTRPVPGGADVLVSVQGLATGTAVIETFVPRAVLTRGVSAAWLLLGLIGVGLLALSALVSAQLARTILVPLRAVAAASELLADGDLSARAAVAGPPEVRQVSSGLNRLAARIGELLAHERETLADLSHRLRTPLTALRIDAESLRDPAEMAQLIDDVDALTRTLNEIIVQARRPSSAAGRVACDAVEIVRERTAFWRALAEDQDRDMVVEIGADWLPVRVPAQDLAACLDILLENVFAHTPERVALGVRLTARTNGGALLLVGDDGPGFGSADSGRRGTSGASSTGLGLDIARRIAEASGGSLVIGRSARGGAAVTVALGPTASPRDAAGRRSRSAGCGLAGPGWMRGSPLSCRTGRALSDTTSRLAQPWCSLNPDPDGVPVMRHRDHAARRDSGLKRLSVLTWRATLLSTVAAFGLAILFGRTAQHAAGQTTTPVVQSPAASRKGRPPRVRRPRPLLGRGRIIPALAHRHPAVAAPSAPAAATSAPAPAPTIAPPTTPPAPAPSPTPAPTDPAVRPLGRLSGGCDHRHAGPSQTWCGRASPHSGLSAFFRSPDAAPSASAGASWRPS